MSELGAFVARIAGQIADESASGITWEESFSVSEVSHPRDSSAMVPDVPQHSASYGASQPMATDGGDHTGGDHDDGDHFSPAVLHQVVMTMEDRIHSLEKDVAAITSAHNEMRTRLVAYENSAT
eukprot:196259-Amphidinium_carterae.1